MANLFTIGFNLFAHKLQSLAFTFPYNFLYIKHTLMFDLGITTINTWLYTECVIKKQSKPLTVTVEPHICLANGTLGCYEEYVLLI